MSVLSLQGVSKTIGGRKIVEGLTMTVKPGEVYGFLGPNGAGKTTTIRMIVGLIKPTSGTIRIAGHDIQKERAKALAHVGAIVENPETYKYLTGRQNLIHYARLAGIRDIHKRVDEVNKIVGLGDRLNDKVKRYSLGMRQRLGVAQALLANPKLLVLDEPTNGLDPAGMREFRELMRRLASEGMAVFVSSHLLSELELMCDRVGILKAGRVIAEQGMDELVRGTVRSVSIRVDNPGRGHDALTAAGLSAHIDGACVVLSCDTDAEVAKTIRTLVNADVEIYAVERQQGSLEEMFLELTEGKSVESLSEVAAGGGRHA